ncbi:MAG: hypothetical protein HYW47_06435 [Deltaproteobacteria bacterium]|nr:hypothetical protein [Deltaproteobacteria bacterium]
MKNSGKNDFEESKKVFRRISSKKGKEGFETWELKIFLCGNKNYFLFVPS